MCRDARAHPKAVLLQIPWSNTDGPPSQLPNFGLDRIWTTWDPSSQGGPITNPNPTSPSPPSRRELSTGNPEQQAGAFEPASWSPTHTLLMYSKPHRSHGPPISFCKKIDAPRVMFCSPDRVAFVSLFAGPRKGNSVFLVANKPLPQR